MTHYANTSLNQNELDIITDFEKRLENIFLTETKVTVKSSKDSVINIVIEVDSHFSLAEIVSLLRMPLGDMYRMADLNKSIYRFKNEVYKLNELLYMTSAIEEFSIYFRDTAITINAISDSSIINEIDFILHAIVRHYKHYSTLIGATPSAIHIPVFENPSIKKAPHSESLDDLSKYTSPYSKFWGFYFDFLDKPLIYNLRRTNILPGDLDISMD